MVYKVLDVFPIGNNTSVTIEGHGEGLKNHMDVISAEGKTYRLLSVAMVSGQPEDESGKTTTVMIEGSFNSKTIGF